MKANVVKMLFGFLGGIALLAFVLIAKHVGLDLNDVEQGGILVAAVSGFGLATHGALMTPTKGE